MTAHSKAVAAVAGMDAPLFRSRSDDAPEFITACKQVKALPLEEHIQKAVNAWPELTTNQKALLSGLFRTAGDVPL